MLLVTHEISFSFTVFNCGRLRYTEGIMNDLAWTQGFLTLHCTPFYHILIPLFGPTGPYFLSTAFPCVLSPVVSCFPMAGACYPAQAAESQQETFPFS